MAPQQVYQGYNSIDINIMQQLSPGLYFVKAEGSHIHTQTKKVFIQNNN